MSLEITEYTIQKSQDRLKLQNEINALIKVGWVPYGNLITHYLDNGSTGMIYIQAMVLMNDNSIPESN